MRMSKKGIDVSHHQEKINWDKVKADGVEFAIIRMGYGKNIGQDKNAIYNIENAIRVGIPVGVYWFLYAVNEKEAVLNADCFNSTILPYKNKIALKCWCDWEYDSDDNSVKRGVKQTKKSRTAICKAFINRMKELGYDCGIYANPDYIRNKFEDISEYPLWLAYYNKNKGSYDPFMWQYSSKGRVAGISDDVDVNILYGEIETNLTPEYYTTPEFTLIDSLNEIGVDSSYKYRKLIAKKNGIEDYKGTAEQNMKLLELLNEGKLIKV